jgi:hypothetical protein
MIVMNIAATYTTLTATFWLTRLIIIGVNAAATGFLPQPSGVRGARGLRQPPGLASAARDPSGLSSRPAVECR